MDKRTSLKMDKSNLKCNNCIECNSTIVLPNHQCSNYNNTQTRLDQIDNLDNYITEINKSTISPVKSNFTRHSSLRSSKSSQNIQRYQNDKLDYYEQLLNNNYNQISENQLYYSFLRLYVDCLTGYTNEEIWHFVNHHNPRIKQFNQGLIIRIPSDIWFIIVTGSVFINGKLYLPHSM